ncbi:MAG: putative hydro-lyase [Dehalococcoidia bacterium]
MRTDIFIDKKPGELRELIRAGEWVRPTAGLVPGYAQANLVVLPKELAFDFILFCQRNPRPCPLLEVLDLGAYGPKQMAAGADLRTDLPKYRIYQDGELAAEVQDISGYWRDDLVAFLIGCSFTFEAALMRAGIPLRHIPEGKNVAMYVTNIATTPAGLFKGPLVVSMRPIARQQVIKAVQITSRYPAVHGAPIHIGDPEAIGIRDIYRPDYGDVVAVAADEEPVFWACGVTPQAVALHSRPALMITHAPGHMFITDVLDEDLAVL